MSVPRMPVSLPSYCLAVFLPLLTCCTNGSDRPHLLLKPSQSASPEEKSGVTINGIERTAGYGVSF